MSTITKDLGAVTAYAYAKEKGYTGTEAEFAELMASYATVAQQAGESAQTASEKAQQASASATSASQSASSASASAQTAQTAQQTATAKASEAQQSAQTATTKAQEASQSASESSQSASTAVQAKQDAQTAKTASETAQASAEGSATTAQTAAQTATQKAAEAAESARTLTIDKTLTQEGQAADAKVVGDEISDLKEDLETNFHINGNVKPNLVVGSFIYASNNSISQSDNFSMTVPIAVKKGQKVTLTARGYNTVVGMIATCNADNSERSTVVASVDSNEHEYIYKVSEDGYVVCSFNHNYNHKISLIIDYYAEIEDVKTSVETIENALDFIYEGSEDVEISVYANGYVYAENNKYVSGGNFNTTNSVHLFKGQTINLTAEGYNNDVGMINLYDPVNDTYKTVVRSANGVTEYSYTATDECDVRMCYRIITGASANIVTNDGESIRLHSIESDISELKEKSLDLEKVEYPQMFTNIICIGDSLTRGESGGSQSVQLSTNYPFYFEKLTGATCYNAGLSGRTTKQWWDEFGSTTTGFANYDCAIIYLGTNGGLTDTIETDCNASDYTQNADTNTGCYGKIIGKIKADAPNCKIFCVAGVNDYIRRATKMNPAVRALAEFYNVGLIDVENCIMSDSGGGETAERYLYRPIDGIHYNKLGYFTLANMIYDFMKSYISKHLNKF